MKRLLARDENYIKRKSNETKSKNYQMNPEDMIRLIDNVKDEPLNISKIDSKQYKKYKQKQERIQRKKRNNCKKQNK